MTVKHMFEFHGLHQLSHHWRMQMHPPARLLLYLQALIGFVLFSVLSDGLGFALKKAKIFLPGSVAGLIVLVSILLVSPSDVLVNFLKPGSSLLLKWLSVLYVPALVVLPVSLKLVPTNDYAKLIAIQIGGVIFVGTFSGWCLIGLMRFQRFVSNFGAVMVTEDHHPPNHASNRELLLSKRTIALMLAAALILSVVYVALPDHDNTIYFFLHAIALPAFFIIGQFLHIRYAKAPIPHPLVTSTAFVIALIAILAASSGQDFDALIKLYSRSSLNMFAGVPAVIGPGDVYLYILNAAIVSMALPIHSQKPTLIAHGIELLTASAIVSFASIILTVGVARALNVSPSVIRSIPLRTATTPIAIATVPFIAGNTGIAGVMSVTTGIIGGAIWIWLFNANRYTKAITRGFSMGSMAQGLGTAIITAEEPESAPFSSISFVTVGVLSSVWIAIPPIRTLIDVIIQS